MLNKLFKKTVWTMCRIFFSIEYRGLDHVPAEGPVIIAANHPSYLDPVLIYIAIDRPVRFMAWDALFKIPILGSIISAFGAFPVDLTRGKGESAYREALKILRDRQALGIFPEGQRSEFGPMGELKTGTARLAVETGAPVVAVTIGGAVRAWPKWKFLPKPAKIVVRYHEPLELTGVERSRGAQDRELLDELSGRIKDRINRALTPSLRNAVLVESWYRQPPSNIRSYEWAPLVALLVALWVAGKRQTIAAQWIGIVVPALSYYLYLIVDLVLISPSRTAKWIRNSMPIWLILIWHLPLTRGVAVPAGERNGWLVASLLVAFFFFFYENYFTLQKFVRGIVVSYYLSIVLLLWQPHKLGTMIAILGFIALFAIWYRVIFRLWIAAGACAVMAVAIRLDNSPLTPLIGFALLAVAVNLYLQAFTSIAYDIRSAGSVEER